MQHSAHTGSGRRQDRVPLEVGIDLRGIDLLGRDDIEDDEPRVDTRNVTLAADGLNVSVGGIAMRSSFIPPLGALLECTFQCPPTGETVCAQGEVIWSERNGPGQGEFGMRFVELDTKSATALRRYIAPPALHEVKPERSRAATLVIDGLGNVIEADLKLADDSRFVLEQQLSFLQLGRGVEVTVPGRGRERGRIASVELRHTHFDVPTLVFGVLLDEVAERQAELVPTHVAPLFSTPFSTVLRPELPVSAQASARVRESGEQVEQRARDRVSSIPEAPQVQAVTNSPALASALVEAHELADEDADHDDRLTLVSAADSAPALCVEDAEVHADGADEPLQQLSGEHERDQDQDDGDDEHEQDEEPTGASATDSQASLMALRVRNLPTHLRALFRAPVARFNDLRQRIEPALREQAEALDLPDAKTRLLMQVARLRALLLQSWSRVRRSTRRTGPRTPRTLRVQRSTLLGLGPAETERVEPSKTTRSVAIAFAVLGVGLGVYALAPRSGADRIKLPERVEGQGELVVAEPALADKDELEFADEELEVVPEPKRTPTRAERNAKARAAKQAAELSVVEAASGEAVVAAAAASESAPFGEAEVPNGRVFTLRMNGPVQLVEGEAREHGFTVRIPGRLAVDKASPIATSHDAVQRAMILNRGGYAELTVDFVPGKSPRYQVRGRDNGLEVTLERL